MVEQTFTIFKLKNTGIFSAKNGLLESVVRYSMNLGVPPFLFLFVSFSSGNPSEESQHRKFGVFQSAFLLLFVVVVLREVMFILICEWSVHNKLRYLISVRDDRFFVFRDSSRPSPKCSPFLFIIPARDTALITSKETRSAVPESRNHLAAIEAASIHETFQLICTSRPSSS